MNRRGCGIGVIIEGLVINRYGIITESAEEIVDKRVREFLKENSTAKDRKTILTFLNLLYTACNNTGSPYKLIEGGFDNVKGGVSRMDAFHEPTVYPTLTEVWFEIKFLAAVDINELVKTVFDDIKKRRQLYNNIKLDSFSISIELEDDNEDGTYLVIEKKSARELTIRVGFQKYIAEGTSGMCGTEIGLPIDQENCESTGIGGVATPTGGFSNKEEEEKKRKLIPVLDEKEPDGEKEASNEKDIDRLRCPKCKSPNVNSDGKTLTCSDCSYTWTLDDEEEALRDNMLPQEDDISSSDYQRTGEYHNGNNHTACIETEQSTSHATELQN